MESQDICGTGSAHSPMTKQANSDCDPVCAEPVQTHKHQSEAYQWARAFELAFIRGDYAEVVRLAVERIF